MPDHDRLASLILTHWSLYQPLMLAQLQHQCSLQEELEKTADQFTDLMYDMVSVRKMEYHQAWELAVREILLPEESSSTSSPKKSPPETSASPMSTVSGWEARMKRRVRTSKPSGS